MQRVKLNVRKFHRASRDWANRDLASLAGVVVLVLMGCFASPLAAQQPGQKTFASADLRTWEWHLHKVVLQQQYVTKQLFNPRDVNENESGALLEEPSILETSRCHQDPPLVSEIVVA